MAEQHPALAGLYQLRQTIGQGGFGKVKLAYHTLTNEPVAIKIMDKKALAHDLPRVKTELSALRELVHENICRLIQVIETAEKYYVVLELCSGGELFDYIVSKDRLDEDEARLCFRQIISAVGFAHSKGFAHRDLKPENFLLDENGNVKLIDFGLCAKPQSGLLNEALATACGSPAYAAPELLRGQLYSGVECDLWSLGILLYALVCGYLPFDDTNLNRLYAKILSGVYEAPTFISDSCSNLIASLIEVDAKRRIGMQALANHPWVTNGGQLNAVRFERSSLQGELVLLDESLISMLAARTALREAPVRDALSAWRYDSLTATYLLLKQAKARAEEAVLRTDLNPQYLRSLLLPYAELMRTQTQRFDQSDSPWVYKSCLRTVHNRVSNAHSRPQCTPKNGFSQPLPYDSPAMISQTSYRPYDDANTTFSRTSRCEPISEEKSASGRRGCRTPQRDCDAHLYSQSPNTSFENRAVRRLLFDTESTLETSQTQAQTQTRIEPDRLTPNSQLKRPVLNTFLVTHTLSPSRSIDSQLDAVQLADAVVRRSAQGEQASALPSTPNRSQTGTPNGQRLQLSTPNGQRITNGNGNTGGSASRSKSETDNNTEVVSERVAAGSIDSQLDALQLLRVVDSINQVALGRNQATDSDSDADSLFGRVVGAAGSGRVTFASATESLQERSAVAATATPGKHCTSPSVSVRGTPKTPPTVIRRRAPKSALLNSIEKRFDRVRAFFTPRRAGMESASNKVRRSRTQKYEHSARKVDSIDTEYTKNAYTNSSVITYALPRRVRIGAQTQNVSPLPILKCLVDTNGVRRLAEPLEIVDRLVNTLQNRKIHVKRKLHVLANGDTLRNSTRSSSLTDLAGSMVPVTDPDASTLTSATSNGGEWKTGKKDRFAAYTLNCAITDDWNAVQLAFELELCMLVEADQLRAYRTLPQDAQATVAPTYAIRRKRLKGDVWSYKRLCDFLLNEF